MELTWKQKRCIIACWEMLEDVLQENRMNVPFSLDIKFEESNGVLRYNGEREDYTIQRGKDAGKIRTSEKRKWERLVKTGVCFVDGYSNGIRIKQEFRSRVEKFVAAKRKRIPTKEASRLLLESESRKVG